MEKVLEKLHFSISIDAPKQKIWDTMLNDVTYRQWTAVFNPAGSYYEGDWSAGSSIRFLGPEKNGSVSGIISQIKESRPYEFISIQHLGEIVKGKETMWPEAETAGTEVLETYTLEETDDGTEVLIDIDTTPEFKNMFQDTWPKALEKLKMLAEKK